MAKPFNLTAQINLQGPANLRPVVSKIKRELSNIKANVNVEIKANAIKKITDATGRLNDFSKAATNANASISNLNQSLSIMAGHFDSIAKSTSASTSGMNKVGKSASKVKTDVHEARTEIEEFGRQSFLAVKRFAAFSVVTSSVYAFTNALSSAYKEFLVFNKEIVRLAQVTNQPVSSLKSLTDEITRLSTGLGVSSSELLNVATTLAQAGLTASETRTALEALAKTALAPSFENITDTTEGAIAVMRQFGLQASDLESALGSINSVAAAFAVESSDLITAIQRTGGVFAASSRGVSEGTDALNEFAAIFTSVRATTRESAETIATGLRTIFTRIQRGKTIEFLKEYGIQLTDIEGKFVGPFEATKRLSEGLSALDPRDIRFSQIVEELGGFRQIGKVIPLIQQFTVAQQALTVAQRGQGSLAKDAVTAQQSLAIQFNKTRESFLALVRDVGESTTFYAFVKTTLTLADAFISLAGSLKPLLPLLAAFTTIKLGAALQQYSAGFFGAMNTTAKTRKFAGGGLVPGSGNGDTVPAMLTPGEYVIRKKAVQAIGTDRLGQINKYASGGLVSDGGNEYAIIGASFIPEKGEYTLQKDAGAEFTTRNKFNAKDRIVYNKKSENVDLSTFPDFNNPNTTDPLFVAYKRESAKGTRPGASNRGRIFEEIIKREYSNRFKRSDDPSAFLDGTFDGGLAEIKSKKEVSDLELGRKLLASAIAGNRDSKEETDAIAASRLNSLSLKSRPETVNLGDLTLINDITGGLGREVKAKKALGGFIKRFESGGEALAKDVMDLGGAKGIRQLLGIPAGNRDFGKLMFGPNIVAGKNLDAVAEYVRRAKEAKVKGAAAQQAAFEQERTGAFKVQIASILPIDSSFDQVYDIEGRRVNIVGGGLLAQYSDVVAEMQSEAAGLASRFSERLRGRTPAPTTARQPITPLDELMGQGNIEGAVLEKALALLGAPLVADASRTRPIDYPAGIGPASQYFKGLDSSSPTEVKRVIDKYSLEKTREEIARAFRENVFANGGSAEDTVPALLTPGEFVINKQAAKKIGSYNLNRLNKADKIQGFNRGGHVQRFAAGGSPGGLGYPGSMPYSTQPAKEVSSLGEAANKAKDALGGFGGVAFALTSVIQPQIEKFAESFGQFNNELTRGISGAIRQGSSLGLSGGIGLRSVGASDVAVARGQIAGAIGGAVGGFITEASGRAIERALLKNTEALNRFDKLVEEANTAPTAELQIEAQKRLEKQFIELTKTVKDAESSIRTLEDVEKLGSAISNVTNAAIVAATAQIALTNAIKARTVAEATSGAASTTVATAGVAATFAGVSATVAKVGVGLLKFAGWIGVAITAIQVVSEVWKYFSTSTSKTTETMNKFGVALETMVKNSRDFSLNNEKYSEEILELARQARQQTQGNETARQAAFGNVQNAQGMVNEINLALVEMIKSQLRAEKLYIQPQELISEFMDRLKESGRTADITAAEQIIKDTSEAYIKTYFTKALQQRNPEITQAEIDKQFRAASPTTRANIAAEAGAAISIQKTAADELSKNMAKVSKTTLNLNDVLNQFSAGLQRVTKETEASFEELDYSLSIFSGDVRGGRASQRFRESANIIENVQAFSQEEIKGALKNILPVIGQGASSDLQKQIQDQILALQVTQTKIPQLLREISGAGATGRLGEENVIRKTLESLFTPLKLDKTTQTGIIDDLISVIQKTSTGEGKTLNEIASNNPALQKAIDASVITQKELAAAGQLYQDTLNKVTAQTEKYAAALSRITQASIQQQKLRAQTNIDIKQALGQEVSFKEAAALFDNEIRSLAGSLDPSVISGELQAASQQLSELRTTGAADTEQGGILVERIQRLRSALDKLANNNDNLRLSVDELRKTTEKTNQNRDFFTSLLEAGRDPQRRLQIEALSPIIQRFIDTGEGARTGQEANLLLRNLDFIRTIPDFARDAQALARLQGSIFAALGREVVQQNPDALPRVTGVLETLDVDLKRAIDAEIVVRQELEKSIRAGGGLIYNEFLYSSIVLNNTNKIWDDFNTKIGKILGDTEARMKAFSEELNKSLKETGGVGAVGPSMSDIQDLINRINSIATRVPSSSFMVVPGGAGVPLPPGQQNKIQSAVPRPSTEKAAIPILESVLGRLTGVLKPEEQKIKTEIERILNEVKKNQNIPVTPPTPTSPNAIVPPNNAGANFFNGANLFINSFKAVFGTETERFNSVIQGLAQVFPTLQAPISEFSKSVNTLVAKLDEINTNGIKGPSIPEKVEVTIAFDEDLIINTSNINNSDLLSQIGVITKQAVETKLKELKTFG